MYGVGWGGAGQIDFTFGLRAGRWERGAMLQPKIYNTESMTIAYIKELVTG